MSSGIILFMRARHFTVQPAMVSTNRWALAHLRSRLYKVQLHTGDWQWNIGGKTTSLLLAHTACRLTSFPPDTIADRQTALQMWLLTLNISSWGLLNRKIHRTMANLSQKHESIIQRHTLHG